MKSPDRSLFDRAMRLTITGLALAGSASMAAAADPAAVFKPDLARGNTIASAVCVACHSADGSRGAPANPIIQGQHPQYLTKQLIEFKSGKRPSPVMQAIASQLTEDDMRHVAAFYASKQPKPGFGKSKDLALLGEKIYRGGIADRLVPACAGCHSPSGGGVPAQNPRLAGQHADYSALQLTAFRDGKRPNSPIMNGVAAKLNDREIRALAEYTAGLQ